MYEPRSAQLTYPVRKELVGKRFLVIEEAGLSRRGRNQNIENFHWKAGYIRACSVKDVGDKELQVLVEYDGVNWECRQWIKIHENTKAFLAENTIVWATRTYHTASGSRSTVSWPALTFVPIVDYLGLSNEAKHPIEFFGDKQMTFVRENEVSQFKDGDERIDQVFHLDPRVEDDLKAWQRLQKAQAFLMNGAVTLTGLRVTVYRLQLRQWYTGCITAHNLSTRELHVMDDNVLQTHPENPALVQINLLADDQELQRILHGKPLKVLPMRKHRHSQIFLQANGEGSKPQEGVTNWHLLRELTVSPPQPGWNHSPMCHVVNGGNGKSPFIPTAVKEWSNEKKPNVSLPRCARRSRRTSSAAKEDPELRTSQSIPDEKPNCIRPHPSESIPFPHYGQVISQSPKPQTPPRVHIVSPPPTQSQHISSPHRLMNRKEKTAVESARTETPFRRQPVESESQMSEAFPGDVHGLPHNGGRSKPSSVACSPSGITSAKTSPKEQCVTHNVESLHKNSVLESAVGHSPTLTSPISSKSYSDNESPERKNKQSVSVTMESSLTTLPPEAPNSDTTAEQPLNLNKIFPNSPNPELATSSVAADQAQACRVPDPTSPTVHDHNVMSNRSHLCLHAKTIAKIQLEDMLLQSTVAEYQTQLIREALSSMKHTKGSDEQFCFIADFYYNLLDDSRRATNTFSHLAAKALELQRLEHRQRQSQLESISLGHIRETLPDDVKARLEAAQETSVKKMAEVISRMQRSKEVQKYAEEKLQKVQELQDAVVGQQLEQNQQCPRTKPHQQQQRKELQQRQQEQKKQRQQKQRRQKQPQQQEQLQQQQQQQKQQQQQQQKQQQQQLLLQQQLQRQRQHQLHQQQQQQLLQQPNQLLKQLQNQHQGQMTKTRERSVFKSTASQGSPKEQAREIQHTVEHLTRPQSKTQIQNVEAHVNYKEQLQPYKKNAIAPFLSADQLLTHLTSTPGLTSPLSYVADNLAMFSGSLIEDTVSLTTSKEHKARELHKSKVSKGLDGLNGTKSVESITRMEDSSGAMTASNGPASSDSVVRRDGVVKSGTKKDNSGRSSTDNNIPRGNKRKVLSPTSSGADSETASKPKRQRKSRQKKEKVPSESKEESPTSSSNSVLPANALDVTTCKTPSASKLKNFDRTVLKAFPADDAIPSSHDQLRDPDDRELVPTKASLIDGESNDVNDPSASPQMRPKTREQQMQYFQPRSITKGIGFVPIKKMIGGGETNGSTPSISNPPNTLAASDGSNVGSPLDVLASVSVWTSNKVQKKGEGKRAITEESVISKPSKKRKDKPKKGKNPKTKNSKEIEGTKTAAAKSEEIVMERSENLGLLGGTAVETTKSFGDSSIPTPSKQSSEVTASHYNHKSPTFSATSSAELTRTDLLSAVEDINAKFNVPQRNEKEPAVSCGLANEGAKTPHSPADDKKKNNIPRTEEGNGDGSLVAVNRHIAEEKVEKAAQGDLGGGSETDRKNIVFVNDQSIDSFVKAVNENAEDDHDNVFNKCLLDRKRQHNQRLNARPKPGNNELETPLLQPSLLADQDDLEAAAAGKIDQSPTNQADCAAKKELKVRKKKRNKENLEVKEGKNLKVNILEVMVDPSCAINVQEVEEKDSGGPKNEVDIVKETNFLPSTNSMKQSDETKTDETQTGSLEPTSKKKAKPKKKSKDIKREKGRKVKENRSKEEWSYFLQQGDCRTLPTMTPCRECRKDDKEESVMDKTCCRFDMFRRCRKKQDKIEVAGFSCPDNAQNDDLKPWIACENISEILTLEMSKYILKNVGDQFCNLVKQEKEAQSWSVRRDGVAWKRAVRGIREMCDACATTIFNVHWVCPKCGFGVCLDCYKSKLHPPSNPEAKQAKEYRWVRCSPTTSHRPQRLVLAQIIPQQTLCDVGDELHKAREFWEIGENCPCKGQIKALEDKPNEDVREEKKSESETTSLTEKIPEPDRSCTELSSVEVEPCQVEIQTEQSAEKCDVEKITEQVSGEERDATEKPRESDAVVDGTEEKTNTENEDENATVLSGPIGALSLLMDYESPISSPATSLVEVMDCEDCSEKTPAEVALASRPSATSGQPSSEQEDYSALIQPRITEDLPAPHSWMCTRPMLRLHCAQHEGNLKSFQSRWEKGEPVLVSYVHKNMKGELWTPEGFAEEFGSEKADVVNCKTGGTLEKLDIGIFWRGFESVKDRPLDSKGEPTLLKLKDWPPEADFVEKMPTRFQDLNQALPLPEYTLRNGSRNLVSRLPDFFVKPDLGPKMYNAYGNAAHPSAGTTNLHIDMSDAVNVMVYVGVPSDGEYGGQERKDSLSCVDRACDKVQQMRARDENERLGALWHIFAAEDANKIRALFHKVAEEKNLKYPINHDPIHDQCFYLDEPLLKRLKDEYDVVGWPIAQFLGDAVFIPAGAPHQPITFSRAQKLLVRATLRKVMGPGDENDVVVEVDAAGLQAPGIVIVVIDIIIGVRNQVRNLHSCVKVAEDFVSPEHVGHCFKLTQEFRHLSDKHTNHEDKLQVKNIIYHAVKDAVSVLRRRERELESRSEATEDRKV